MSSLPSIYGVLLLVLVALLYLELLFSKLLQPMVRVFREHVIAESCSEEVQAVATKISIMATLIQIDEDRVRLSAAGLFNVGMFLIPGLTGATVTYMVILLQS
ncbi:uncharacterized protein LOC124328388 [Daphnia pulicaria]|uniref:uncharacterized protein LOC124328388 n=1 Tax=Daphnia pulicaria TaxID=35523 RepID=UPI001EEA2F18|nr:uncharacterized protein LOC124328388 [Daphnia pulicaria]